MASVCPHFTDGNREGNQLVQDGSSQAAELDSDLLPMLTGLCPRTLPPHIVLSAPYCSNAPAWSGVQSTARHSPA